MREIRLAQTGDTARQKDIWKLCFGDSDQFIDFYYANQYQENATVVLLENREIISMLTMLSIKIMTSNQESFNATMLYAIATHPQYQNRGCATSLIDYTHQKLKENDQAFSVLVPSTTQLFDFYRQIGFQDGFYVREVLFTNEWARTIDYSNKHTCMLSNISSAEYNQRRNEQLKGRPHIAYTDEEITYQKQLSQQFGADIFGLEIDGTQGCAAIERFNAEKVFIKELLMPPKFLSAAIKQIAQLWPAREYVLRTPAFLGEQLEGTIRPFGMIRVIQEKGLEITAGELGYLGVAFD